MLRWKVNSVLVMVWIMLNAGLRGRVWLIASLHFLKADGGYTFIYSHRPGEMTKKGNYVSDYWSPRHRMYLSLTGKLNWQRFEFSLRERYQYTYRTSQLVSKYDGDDGSQKADEEITGKGKNVLRSRLQAEWNIKKSRFAPYASCELYHSMSDSWALDKTRWTLVPDTNQ